jgi:glycosylphosphatidylinositol transamidase (GPIT) subunit GPI8
VRIVACQGTKELKDFMHDVQGIETRNGLEKVVLILDACQANTVCLFGRLVWVVFWLAGR